MFVMVIDDSLIVRTILQTCLRRAGYDVETFNDGPSAFLWSGRVPNVVIVDIGLPVLDGYDVIRAFKQSNAHAKTVFIILTARDGILDRVKGRLCGAQAYII